MDDQAIIDANVLIALLDGGHIHHDRAVEVLANYSTLLANPINLAEVLIGYPAAQQEAVARELRARNIVPHAPDPENAAQLYARTASRLNLPLPDAIAVATLIDCGGRLLTFDQRMAKKAQKAGFDVEYLG